MKASFILHDEYFLPNFSSLLIAFSFTEIYSSSPVQFRFGFFLLNGVDVLKQMERSTFSAAKFFMLLTATFRLGNHLFDKVPRPGDSEGTF